MLFPPKTFGATQCQSLLYSKRLKLAYQTWSLPQQRHPINIYCSQYSEVSVLNFYFWDDKQQIWAIPRIL